MSKQMRDIFIVGFALFSMFFGAGNLMFPPFLGMESGKDWLIPLIGFVVADAGIAMLVIIATARWKGSMDDVLRRAGKGLARVMSVAALACLALLVIPRTCATTYEMGIMPIFGDHGPVAKAVFSIIFFGLTLAFTIRSSKVIDIIGKYLTPALLLVLFVLIVKGIISPAGPMSPEHMIDKNLFGEGISQGYQTMDALGAASMATIMLMSIIAKGYTSDKDQIGMTIKAGFVACVFLAVVYGGLTYLGATVSTLYDTSIPQASLLVEITSILLYGQVGKVILGVIVALACLTTSTGLTASISTYFEGISKASYKQLVIGICVASMLISNLGVDSIIAISVPILQTIYPVLLAIVVMELAGKHIKNDNAFKGAAYVTLVISLLSAINGMTGAVPFIQSLPLAGLGFNWVIPAILGGIVGNFIKSNKQVA
ncbi:branched-chain amino acid transport system II carrier protein [Clostridioides difficile DA00154]|nr:branched-chain amino acid transport system II carrier protein [Clostridioides difficile]EQG65064.1 branched-chain amino acid transport system II carrier protein [Clostridioides difficile DA00154]